MTTGQERLVRDMRDWHDLAMAAAEWGQHRSRRGEHASAVFFFAQAVEMEERALAQAQHVPGDHRAWWQTMLGESLAALKANLDQVTAARDAAVHQ